MYSGKGIFTKADGSYYEGEFKNDKWCGVGKYWASQTDYYEGEFKNEEYHGYGVL